MPLVDLVVFLRVEHPAERRLDPEQREVVAGDHLGRDPFGLVVDADRGLDEPAAEDVGERLRALLQVLVERIGMHPRPGVAPHVGPLLIEHHQLFGSGHRQFPEKNLVDQREDRRICSNSKRQRQDRDGCEERAAAKTADGQTDIGRRGGHDCGLDGLAGSKVCAELDCRVATTASYPRRDGFLSTDHPGRRAGGPHDCLPDAPRNAAAPAPTARCRDRPHGLREAREPQSNRAPSRYAAA